MSLEAQDVSQVRLARNETLFRAVNERVELLSDRFDAGVRHSFVCECSDLSCASQIELTVVEVVVARYERYTVVEKIEAGRDVAVATDPRHHEYAAAADAS
jgi:hypothetical protein